MIENVTAADKFLYHYTKASTALEYILKNQSLRLSRFNNTNDPKETKSWEFNLFTNENRDLGKYNMPEESNWLSRELKNKARVACFCMDTPPMSGNHLEDIFNRGFSKPRMWAQYAERHAGVCFVFDALKLLQAIKERLTPEHFVMSGPVKYVNRRVIPNFYRDQPFTINVDVLEKVGRSAYPELHLRTHFRELFFEKMVDWDNEAEWQLIAFSKLDEDLYVQYGEALVGLIFGEETSDQAINDIMELTDASSLLYMGLKWRNSSPWYNYGNFRYLPRIKNSP